MESNKGTIFLVDSYALIFQVFYAIREMRSPKGMPTNALFGFTRDLLYLHDEKKPEYLVCVFDEGEPANRIELFAEYKANRSEMPEELRMQMAPIGNLLKAMNIPQVSKEGIEADDIIATIAREAEKIGLDVYICTSDKDCRQLISDRIKIYNLRKHSVLDRDGLKEDWGIEPEQVVDLQALVGDSVDNINGVPGVGIKTAAKLLQEYSTVENVLANVDKISGTKRRENLKSSVEIVERNKQLVRLDTAVPMKMDWDDWRLKPMNPPALLEQFREWGFHRFADQVQETSGKRPSTTRRTRKDNSDAEQNGLFPETENELVSIDESITDGKSETKKWHATYHLVNSAAGLQEVVKKLQSHKRFAFDLETTSLDYWQAEIVGIALCCESGEAWYVPVRGPDGETALDEREAVSQLQPLFENERIAKINQNIKYDALVLRQHKVEVKGIAGDSMVADYLLNAGEKNHSIHNLARTYLQHEVIPITDLIGKKKQQRMDEVALNLVAEYAGEDADVAYRLCELLEQKLEKENLKALYDELEIPLIDVLVEMEFNGIRLDVKRLGELSQQLGGELATTEEQIYELAGKEFNIGSLKQLRRVLFADLGLPVQKKTGITGEPSTDQDSLERLAALGHELPKRLLHHRAISKLKGTYVDTLPNLVNPGNGRLHASFNQTIAATGRLSSSDPNLQNIPIRTAIGGQIRQAFLPEEGWTLLTADYSQIELRLLAHFSNDPELRRAFRDDRDVHSLVAAQIYGVDEKDVTSDMRRMAKTVNFGVIYGMSAFGLAQRLQIKKEDAEAFIEAYFGKYPSVLTYQQELLQRCRTNGFVSTILGRRRSFQREIIREKSTYRHRNQAEREAINMEIQGSAADLIKVAMLNIHRRLRKEMRKTRLLLQIHDELVFECPQSELESVAGEIKTEMTSALQDRIQVPLKVDMATGPNWLDVEEYRALM